MRSIGSLLLALVCMAGSHTPTYAQVPEIRFAQQFSMGYPQFDVMRHRDLLQKHAAALGIPEVKVSYIVFNGPDMMNDALLSGAIDIASGGVPGLLTIWGKTRGTAQEVRGISAMSQQRVPLTSRDPRIRSIRDFTPNDRIALPAPKVSARAVMLQMAGGEGMGRRGL
jgi:NitT/TauT family transport system substrate-binding protein